MKKENLKDVIDKFINERLDSFKKEREVKENDFTEEIGEINEFKNLSDVEKEKVLNEIKSVMDERTEGIEYDFSEEEVHKLELDLEEMGYKKEDDEMEECLKKLKELADDIKIVDDIIKIPCKVNGVERMLVNESNCNIKPIPLLNVALITNLNLSVLEVELNDYMESIMDVNVLLLVDLGSCTFMHLKTDVRTLCNLGLMVAVDSLLSEVELSPIEFRGVTSLMTVDEFTQLLKFSTNVE